MDIQKVCQKCRGTGEVEGEPDVTCDRCGGTGRLDEGEISNGSQTLDARLTALEDIVDDIKDKCDDILEKLE